MALVGCLKPTQNPDALCLDFIFGQTDPTHFSVGVGHALYEMGVERGDGPYNKFIATCVEFHVVESEELRKVGNTLAHHILMCR